VGNKGRSKEFYGRKILHLVADLASSIKVE